MPKWQELVDFSPVAAFINIVDVLLVWFVFYKLITIIKGTKAVQLLKGIFVIIIARILTEFLVLIRLRWMMDQVLPFGFLGNYYHLPT